MVTHAELDELDLLAANASRLLKSLAPAPTVPDGWLRAQADRIAEAVPRLVAEVRRLNQLVLMSTLDDVEHDRVSERLAAAEAERDRLRKLFDDAGQGEYNVLALIDHYQAETIAEEERRRTAEAERLTLARARLGLVYTPRQWDEVHDLAERILKEADGE